MKIKNDFFSIGERNKYITYKKGTKNRLVLSDSQKRCVVFKGENLPFENLAFGPERPVNRAFCSQDMRSVCLCVGWFHYCTNLYLNFRNSQYDHTELHQGGIQKAMGYRTELRW